MTLRTNNGMKARTGRTDSAAPQVGNARFTGVHAPVGSSAFTMVEIAIALGVIAFALIAIIGVLPSGLQVGRDNREETIINQDARLLLEALRNGARGPNDIASFVDILDGTPVNQSDKPADRLVFSDFVQFLTRTNVTNVAVMRAISGSVVGRTSTSTNEIPGLRYELRSQIYPAFSITNIDTNHVFFAELAKNTYEVRLLFRWPVKPNGALAEAANRQVVRTVLSGAIDTNGFFASQEFWP